MSVQLQKATQYYYQRAVMAIFPLTPDQTIAQMWSNGARGGDKLRVFEASVIINARSPMNAGLK